MSASIRIEGATKIYDGDVRAVDAIDMEIGEGEFFALLGPSGCGKTTTLRMIAGFEIPTFGIIRVGGQDVTHMPAHKRDMGMVFQNYALFPHRTVRENVGFGLRMRGVDRATIARKVDKALEMVSLTSLGDRKPGQLSGGQQQRVALARAIVIEPRVLLCDEPLGALDKKLRQQMQFELKELQKSLGVTTVFVTHDQEEALAMSDRIAVMNGGRVEQIGTPFEVYNQPRTSFTADFIGDTNLLTGVAGEDAGRTVLRLPDGQIVPAPPGLHGPSSVALRPESITIAVHGEGLQGQVDEANFLGGSILYRIDIGAGRHMLARSSDTRGTLAKGTPVGLSWAEDKMVALGE